MPDVRPRDEDEVSAGRPQEAGPSKRGRIARQACEPCRAGKRKCDGNHPCSYCINTGRVCIFAEHSRRQNRRRSETPKHSEPVSHMPPAATVPHMPPTATVSQPSVSHVTANSPAVTASNASGISPGMSTADDNTLARIVHVMKNGRVSRYPSPGNDPSPHAGDFIASKPTEADLLDRLHRHLTLVFSLRSFPKGGDSGDNEEELDVPSISTFFLPTRADGQAYVQCYFEHATSTYRYLKRQDIEKICDDFYENDGNLSDKDDVVLLLMIMAIGCLWTPSWTGVSPHIMTKKAFQLYKAAKRQLESLSLVRPRLRMVQVHIALAHLHLGMSNFRSAWVAFGLAARLSQLLRLHRRSPDGTPPEVDEPRRTAFWSSFMMDRYLALVLGCPVLYDERDITQHLPYCPGAGQVMEDQQDETQRLIGSLAHIRLSRILGHALRALQSPAEMSDGDRALTVRILNDELDSWLQETPTFFHPDRQALSEIAPFVRVSPFFLRQQQAVQSAFHFIKLFIHRSYLLDQFINRLPVDQSPSPQFMLSREIDICVEAAMAIARSVSKMGQSPGAKGTFWNSAYICFASLTVLLVYLMVYEDAPRRREIEEIIETTMAGHIQLTGSTLREREMILEESRRITESLRQRQEHAPVGQPPVAWPTVTADPFAGCPTNWDPLWQNTLDMLGLDLNLGNVGSDTFNLDFLQE